MSCKQYVLSKDEMDEIANASMNSTIYALISENLISKEEADKFLSSHVSLYMPKKSIFDTVKKLAFRTKQADSEQGIGTFKISVMTTNEESEAPLPPEPTMPPNENIKEFDY